jgi:hypothetical protein
MLPPGLPPILGSAHARPLLSPDAVRTLGRRFNLTFNVTDGSPLQRERRRKRGSRQPSPRAARIYNPFVFGDGSVIVNVADAVPSHAGRGSLPRVRSVWLSSDNITIRHVLDLAEDVRGIELNGEPFAIFTRYRRRRSKTVWLARLRPPYRELMLQPPPHFPRSKSEGNWLPFVHRGELAVSYTICPHVVLRIDTTHGNSTEVHRTRSTLCQGREAWDVPHSVLRGSASGVGAEDGAGMGSEHALGLAHTRRGSSFGVAYAHLFVKRRTLPPFDILSVSQPFRLPPYFGLRYDITQYCLSLRIDRTDGSLQLDYSASDAVALTLWVPRSDFCAFTGWCTSAP